MKKTGLYNSNGEELTISEVISILPLVIPLDEVNRVEVIDRAGRSYVNRKPHNTTEISFQDRGRTLKVFINNDIDE